ncbi:hypothetical protein SARC_16872 [Sphaeroforma arctica JP610]|uniref:Uncharacterized protein n=1 Tax=Sphaeroforma arctica JP610 TaxID=667725 RepID=A0A0L0F1W9_9EUKA|nr:hypothetical protein SARC_16872 [Sphaeroforma arctica JP610]KNC70599.1 hypothetical protein SARC_16872 [Sphaeroforma arctica JP610]|eukprot:XP_014144501.1 hypothetical protein SARC_16872 [Sphaeroforma arctica JP610]
MAPDRLSRERCESTELPTRCLDTTECTHPDTPASQPPHAHTHSSPSATSGDDSPDKHRPATDRYTHTRTQSHKSGLTYTVASRSATHLSAVPGEGSARDRPRSQPPRRICALPPKLVFKRTSTQPNLNRTSDFGTGPG